MRTKWKHPKHSLHRLRKDVYDTPEEYLEKRVRFPPSLLKSALSGGRAANLEVMPRHVEVKGDHTTRGVPRKHQKIIPYVVSDLLAGKYEGWNVKERENSNEVTNVPK